MGEYARYLKTIPVIPEVSAKILSIAEDKLDISFKELESIIKIDPGLSAKILKVANSALYARQKKVTSLQTAITLLGFFQGLFSLFAIRDIIKVHQESFPALIVDFRPEGLKPYGLPAFLDAAKLVAPGRVAARQPPSDYVGDERAVLGMNEPVKAGIEQFRGGISRHFNNSLVDELEDSFLVDANAGQQVIHEHAVSLFGVSQGFLDCFSFSHITNRTDNHLQAPVLDYRRPGMGKPFDFSALGDDPVFKIGAALTRKSLAETFFRFCEVFGMNQPRLGAYQLFRLIFEDFAARGAQV